MSGLSTSSLLQLILVPTFAYLGKVVFEAYLKFGGRKRARLLELLDVRTEVRVMFASLRLVKEAWRNAWDSGLLKQNVENDDGYAPYMPPSDKDYKAYENLRASLDFLSGETVTLLRQFYDQDSVIRSTLNDMRSDAFRNLTPAKKLELFDKLLANMDHHERLGWDLRAQLRLNTLQIRQVTWLEFLRGHAWLRTPERWDLKLDHHRRKRFSHLQPP